MSWASFHYHTRRKFRHVAEKRIVSLKKTTTATVTATSLNKSFNEKNNGCVRALSVSWNICFAVLSNTTTLKWPNSALSGTTTANFLNFYFEFIMISNIQFRDSFGSDKQIKWLYSIASYVVKYKIVFQPTLSSASPS